MTEYIEGLYYDEWTEYKEDMYYDQCSVNRWTKYIGKRYCDQCSKGPIQLQCITETLAGLMTEAYMCSQQQPRPFSRHRCLEGVVLANKLL